jgi:AraC family transcriptional regulator
VVRIAQTAGYETHEAFTRAFTEMFSLAPSQYRKAHRIPAGAGAATALHYAADHPPSHFTPHKTGGPAVDVHIETLEPTRVAFMRHIGPYMQVGQTWQRFMAWCGQHGLFGPQTRMIGLCHDDPDVTPADKLRYDACVPVNAGFQPQGDVGVQIIEGGDYAVTRHHGPYERIGEAYARLCGEWLPTSGREPRSAPSFDVYLNSPMNTKPEDLLTDIYMPLVDR